MLPFLSPPFPFLRLSFAVARRASGGTPLVCGGLGSKRVVVEMRETHVCWTRTLCWDSSPQPQGDWACRHDSHGTPTLSWESTQHLNPSNSSWNVNVLEVRTQCSRTPLFSTTGSDCDISNRTFSLRTFWSHVCDVTPDRVNGGEGGQEDASVPQRDGNQQIGSGQTQPPSHPTTPDPHLNNHRGSRFRCQNYITRSPFCEILHHIS